MWWRKKRERDLERELRDHLDLEAEERRDQYAARRALGNIALIKEDTRAMWSFSWLDRVTQDVRYAFRGLAKSPGFAFFAVFSLALGIGANTAIFSVVNAVLLKPLSFPQPQQLVQVWEAKPAQGYFRNPVNGVNFLDWRERSHGFSDMAAIDTLPTNLTGLGDPLALDGLAVSPQFFSILGIAPRLGRTFGVEEGRPGRENAAILSYRLWQSQFGGDPTVIGRKVLLSGSPATIVGVMPPGFGLPNRSADIWMPLPIVRSPAWGEGRHLTVIARLKPGVRLNQAQEDLRSVAAQSARERPAFDEGWTADAVPMLGDATGDVRLPLLVLLGAVGLVLLIACANIANLLLMRSAKRSREIAVRVALGAGKGRLLQHLLSESLVLALVACCASLGVAYGGVNALLALIPRQAQLPRMDTIHMDGSVFLFALALAVLTGIVFGLAPSLQPLRTDPQQALQQGAIRTAAKGFWRQLLVVAEVALSLVLLIGAGLMLRSFHKLISVNPGFETERILTMAMFTSPAKYLVPNKRADYFLRALNEVRAVPGVRDAGSVHFLPLENLESGSCFARANEPPPNAAHSPDARFLVISPGYFQTMGTPLVSGRHFDARDRFESPSVIMVNQAFVKRFFSNEDPIGQKLNVCWGREFHNPAEIVGVVGDARHTELQASPQPTIFIDNLQSPMFFATLVIRAAGDPLQITRSVQSAVRRVDPDQAFTHVQTMEQVVSDSVGQPRLQMVLLLVFGGIAGLLAVIGVYGVVAYSAAQRTREIAIRVALGARPIDVRRLVLGEGIIMAALGIGIGVAGALAMTRVLQTLLFETAPTDPTTLVVVAGVVLLVVLLATVLPAARASRADPIAALRCE
jgi:putative ABC transport system permease protein